MISWSTEYARSRTAILTAVIRISLMLFPNQTSNFIFQKDGEWLDDVASATCYRLYSGCPGFRPRRSSSIFPPSREVSRTKAGSHRLQLHLANEPPGLALPIQYPINMKALSERVAKHSMDKTSTVCLPLMLWLSLDLKFEDGNWRNFPPVPWPVK